MNFFLLLLVAVSLSMDTFSLSLAYGTIGMVNKDKYILSGVVGLFHFFMPVLGFFVGSIILNFIKINPDILVSIILSFIGFEMIVSSFKEEKVKIMNRKDYFLFALAVSIDSFSVGITLNDNDGFIMGPLLFCVTSFIFTLLGLFLGDKLEEIFGRISVIIGGIILIGVGLYYLL